MIPRPRPDRIPGAAFPSVGIAQSERAAFGPPFLFAICDQGHSAAPRRGGHSGHGGQLDGATYCNFTLIIFVIMVSVRRRGVK